MGKVIICNGKLAKTPYIVKETERKLYCIEEICHYVSTNIYSIDLDFFTPELIYYIKDELGLKAAADKHFFAAVICIVRKKFLKK